MTMGPADAANVNGMLFVFQNKKIRKPIMRFGNVQTEVNSEDQSEYICLLLMEF